MQTRITSIILTGLATTLMSASPILNSFKTLLTESAEDLLEMEGKELQPDGYEIRDRLLRPLLERHPPRPIEEIDGKAHLAFDERADTIKRLMAGQVKLLGGIPWQEVGEPINWATAPEGDWQWATHLNRHYFLFSLAFAYRNSGDRVYSDKIVDTLLDWIERMPLESDSLTWVSGEWSRRYHNLDAAPTTREGVFPGYVDGPWTSLSAAARIDYWLELLQIIENSPSLNNEALARILLSAIDEHRRVMLDYPRQMNQFQATSAALIQLGIYFPFFQGAEFALEVGWDRLKRHTLREIYPDGSLAECSPNYGMGMIKRLSAIRLMTLKAGYDVPDVVSERLQKASEYMALIADPQLRSPRIAKGGPSLREALEEVNASLEDETVSQRLTEDPASMQSIPPCQGFPWAGHYVFRSGWDADATWLFFEPGPRGSGHADAAQLGIQLFAEGAWLLMDPGFYSYSGAGEAGLFSSYFKTSQAHNLVTVDGLGQRFVAPGVSRGPNEQPGNYNWSPGESSCSAEGIYTLGFGEGDFPLQVSHARHVNYDRERNRFVIIDTLAAMDPSASAEHELEWRWQLAPGAVTSIKGNNATVINGGATMQLSMQGSGQPGMQIISGQRDPIGGWFSESYGKLSSAPMLVKKMTTQLPVEVITTIDIGPTDREHP